jgi:CheY-like chemotaxis protein
MKEIAMSKKILVVDDEPDMVTFLCTLFEDNGYITTKAADGEEALEKIKQDPPDLISLDLLMPNKTGIKMFRELRKDEGTKDIPVVMVTGFGKDDVPSMDFKEWVKKRAIRPPEAYIEKPVNPELLLESVRKVLG